MNPVFRTVGAFRNIFHINRLQKRPLLEDFGDYRIVFKRGKGARTIDNFTPQPKRIGRRGQQ